MAMITAENVTKRFGNNIALDGLSINVEKGSVYGLVGPNGAGKTTFIKVLMGVWRAGDEILREIRTACLAKAFGYMLQTLVFGEFLLFVINPDDVMWYAPSIIVWSIPALVYTVLAVKNGLFQWGGKKADSTGKAKLAKSTALGALFFGVVMGGPECIKDGAFDPVGIVKIIGMGAMWGILFYLMFSAMLRLGEKRADKEVQEAENEE